MDGFLLLNFYFRWLLLSELGDIFLFYSFVYLSFGLWLGVMIFFFSTIMNVLMAGENCLFIFFKVRLDLNFVNPFQELANILWVWLYWSIVDHLNS